MGIFSGFPPRFPHNCLNCGSLLGGDGALCTTCRGFLLGFPILSHIDSRFTVTFWLAWRPGANQRDLMVGAISRAFKGKEHSSEWTYYSREFSARLLADAPLQVPSRALLIPAPSHGGQDHAYFWAKGLAMALGFPFQSCLEKKEQDLQQKGLSRTSRIQIQINCPGAELLHRAYSQDIYTYVFCDDIFTTGSTANAAFEALGRPKNFQVWTLVRRFLK